MQVVYGSVTAVIQSLGSLGSSVVKFIKGDFSGAWKDAKASVTDFSKNYDKSVKNFEDGAKQQTKTEKEELEKRRKASLEASEKQDQDIKDLLERNQKLIDKAQADDETRYNNRLSNVDRLNTGYVDKLQEGQKNVTQNLYKSLTDRIDTEIALEKKKADEIVAINQSEADAKTAIQEAFISNMMRFGQGLRQIAGDNKELAIAGIILEQSAAVASIVINTQKNAAKYGYVSPLGITELVAGGISVASAIAAGAKGIQDIRSGNASGSNMSFGNQQMTPSYSTAPQFNVVGASGVNQIAQVVNQSQQPLKAYVVSSEISSQQSLDRNKVMSASLG